MSRPGSNYRGLFRSVAVALTTRKQFSSAVKHGSNITAHVTQGWCDYHIGVRFTMPASTYYTTEDTERGFSFGEKAPVTVIKSNYAGRVELVVILVATTSCSQKGYKPDLALKMRSSNGRNDDYWGGYFLNLLCSLYALTVSIGFTVYTIRSLGICRRFGIPVLARIGMIFLPGVFYIFAGAMCARSAPETERISQAPPEQPEA